MSATTQVRGLNRALLHRIKQQHHGMTQGEILNQAMELFLSRATQNNSDILITIPPIDPELDMDDIQPVNLPGVSLAQTVLDNR